MNMPRHAPNWARSTHYRKLDNRDKVITMPITNDGIWEGDLSFFDVLDGKVKTLPARSAVALDDDAAVRRFIGISTQTYPVAHHIRPDRQPGDTELQAVFFIGDVIARLIMMGGEAIDFFTPVYPSSTPRLYTTVAAGRTEPIGYVIIDVGEGKIARATSEGEEVSILLRKSYILNISG